MLGAIVGAGACASIAGIDDEFVLGTSTPTAAQGGAPTTTSSTFTTTTASSGGQGGAPTTTSSTSGQGATGGAGAQGGEGGSGGSGGSGGDASHLTELRASLDGMRIEFPCLSLASPYCSTSGTVEDARVAAGTAGVLYDIDILVRGVLETGGHDGGAADGQLYVGGYAVDSWNSYGLEISDPPASYFVNHGVCCEPRCYAIDIATTVQVRQGASVRLWGDDRNKLSTRNLDGNGVPITIPGVPSAPDDGQFVQLDVVSASVAP